MTNLYETLGVPRDADAEAIKKAYRDKAKILHPDKPGGNKEKFQALEIAYRVLSDPDERAHYDRTGQLKREQSIASSAAAMMIETVMKFLDAPNPIFGARDALYMQIQSTQAQAQLLQTGVKKLEQMLTRLKRKPSTEPYLETAFQARMADYKKGVEGLKNVELVIRAAIKLLAEYEYNDGANDPLRQMLGEQIYQQMRQFKEW